MRFTSKRFDKYVVVAPGSDYGIAMWGDLKRIDNVTFLDYVVPRANPLITAMHHAHFSFAVNSKRTLPLQGLWRGAYALNDVDMDDGNQWCVIYTDISACRTDTGFIESLRERDNVKLVLVIVNIMDAKSRLMEERLPLFDAIFSFDKKDCEKYGFTYQPTIYSRIDVAHPGNTSDAFFIGAAKGERHRIARGLFRSIVEGGGKADFFIVGVKRGEELEPGICYNKKLAYSDVLSHVGATNCLIEIMGGGQEGLTLRAMEAICQNKRLLTNNPSVQELKFYETGYIRYSPFLGKDDVSFVLDHSPVDYGYNNEFSPIHVLEAIDEFFRNEASDAMTTVNKGELL